MLNDDPICEPAVVVDFHDLVAILIIHLGKIHLLPVSSNHELFDHLFWWAKLAEVITLN